MPRDNKVGRSATRRMAGLAGFRVGIAQSLVGQTGRHGFPWSLVALRELTAMTAIEGKGRGIVVRFDCRSRISDVLNALLRSPVVTARGLADGTQDDATDCNGVAAGLASCRPCSGSHRPPGPSV